MTERPILFSGPMVRAILEGRKTQTRRVAEVAKSTDYLLKMSPALWATRCPFGAPGDLLWVRETFAAVFDCPALPCACEEGAGTHRRILYRADGDVAELLLGDYACGFDCGHEEPGCAGWTPSIHMPRSASRITLEVSDVRVERLQEVSQQDAWDEGCRAYPDSRCGTDASYWACDPGGGAPLADTPRDEFASLWNSINEKRGYTWASNPWVWVVSFRRVEEQRAAAGGGR